MHPLPALSALHGSTPLSCLTQLICAAMMLTGGMMWGFLIGTFCGLAASLSPAVATFRHQLSQLNNFMAAHSLPSNLRFRLREYFYETGHLRATDDQNTLLARLSPAMQSEVHRSLLCLPQAAFAARARHPTPRLPRAHTEGL